MEHYIEITRVSHSASVVDYQGERIGQWRVLMRRRPVAYRPWEGREVGHRDYDARRSSGHAGQRRMARWSNRHWEREGVATALSCLDAARWSRAFSALRW
jgi:hypothetical protein